MQEFLAKVGVEASEEINARQATLKRKDAIDLCGKVSRIYAAKGKKVVHFDLKKDKPDQATLLQHVLGPTGNLRAPALRKGKTLVVGFDQETYETLFGV